MGYKPTKVDIPKRNLAHKLKSWLQDICNSYSWIEIQDIRLNKFELVSTCVSDFDSLSLEPDLISKELAKSQTGISTNSNLTCLGLKKYDKFRFDLSRTAKIHEFLRIVPQLSQAADASKS